MGYYIRVLGTSLDNIPLEESRRASEPAVLGCDERDEAWEELVLAHSSGQEIAVIEKNPVLEGQLGGDELQEFIDEILDYKPESRRRLVAPVLIQCEGDLRFSASEWHRC